MRMRYLPSFLIMAGLAFGCFSSIGCGGGGSSSGGTGGGTGSRVTIGASGARSENIPLEVDVARSKVSTPFTREVTTGGTFLLTAPEGVADRQFQHWLLNGQFLTNQPTLQTQAPPGDVSLVAVYVPRTCGPNGFTPNFAGEIDPQDGLPVNLYWWHEFPVRVYFDETKALVTQSVIDQILAGFDTWHAATGVLAAYEVTTDPASAHITVRFTHQEQGSGIAFTDIGFFTDDKTMTDATITFIVSRISADRYTQVGAHEFGHALGLEGHSSAATDVMSIPSGPLPLTARDINTLASGYCVYYGQGRHSTPHPTAASNRTRGKAHITCGESGSAP